MVSEKGIIVPVNPVGALFTEARLFATEAFYLCCKGAAIFRDRPMPRSPGIWGKHVRGILAAMIPPYGGAA